MTATTWDLRDAVGRALGQAEAVNVAFAALRDERAEPDVDNVTLDADGGFDYDLDYEPMLAIAHRAIIATGLGHLDVEGAACEAIWQYEDLASEVTYHVYHGEMHKPEARAALQALKERQALATFAPDVIDTSIFWRVTGHAPRLASNGRTRGSRRRTARAESRGDPDLDKPPSHRRFLIGGRR